MAGELMSLGIQKLWDLLNQECGRFQGVFDQLDELKRDLRFLSSYLKDEGAKKHTSATVKDFLEQIKEIICDAEDEVETFIQKEKLGESSGIMNRTIRLAFIIPNRLKIASSMRGISTRITKVMEKFKVQKTIGGSVDLQLLQERQNALRKEPPGEYRSEFVGLEENVTKLVAYLVEQDNVEVVSITGMGGLGKTTLARQVFNHEDVKNKFDRLTWVCVTQVLNLKNVWQTILLNLTPKEMEKEILKMTEDTLMKELFQLLKTSRSLIVFDDIWEQEHWELIRKIFPPGKDWKVLLTSRNEIATMHRNTIKFKPKCLTTEDSWTLFKMIALPRDDALEFVVDEEMKEMGKKMLEHCGGLPLAIRVLGGLLAETCTLHDWKRVYDSIGSHLLRKTGLSDDNNSSDLYHVLSLSFEELPSHLKHCFLYLAHFPEDYQICVADLSYYWAAEGIHRDLDGKPIRDAGDEYIKELVRRNMVISQRNIKSLRFERCHLHDLMREICLSKAKEENFLQIDGIRSQTEKSQSRRFVWQYPTTLDGERDISNPKLRSLLIVNNRWEHWVLSGFSFKRLQLLRVLDLRFADFEGGKLPSGIGKLIHLRYLSLEMAGVYHDLPSSLQNLKLLIYLNLFIEGFDTFVPNVLMGMKELRYLELPVSMHKKTKLDLSNLDKLETLKNFSTKHSSLEDLRHMPRLRTLDIYITEVASVETLSASIGGLKHLEDLRILSHVKIEAGLIVNFVHLKQLTFSNGPYLGISMPGLPKPFPYHLTAIILSNFHLKEDPMPILEKLPQLKYAELYNLFCGRKMVCSGGGFPQLQELHLGYMDELEEWIVEEGCMPLLRVLFLKECKKLKEIPDGLRYILSLKELLSRGMREEWEKRLSEGGEDYYKVQHIPSVKFYPDYLL